MAGWLSVAGRRRRRRQAPLPRRHDQPCRHLAQSRDGLPHILFEKEPADDLGYLFLPQAARDVAALTGRLPAHAHRPLPPVRRLRRGEAAGGLQRRGLLPARRRRGFPFRHYAAGRTAPRRQRVAPARFTPSANTSSTSRATASAVIRTSTKRCNSRRATCHSIPTISATPKPRGRSACWSSRRT